MALGDNLLPFWPLWFKVCHHTSLLELKRILLKTMQTNLHPLVSKSFQMNISHSIVLQVVLDYKTAPQSVVQETNISASECTN
jgi:hypothetical protein